MTFKNSTVQDLKAHTLSQWLNVQSPLHLLIIITSMVFLSDAIVMPLVALLPPLPFLVVTLIDSLLVVLLLFPSLYIFVFRQSRLQITELLKANELLETQITERKRAEETLQKSNEQYRLLIETMNEGLAVIDENGMWTYVNDRLCEMLGHSRDKIIWHAVTDLLDEENRKIFKEQKENRREGESRPYEMSYLREDGQRIFSIISLRPIFDADGRFRGSFAVITDITECKRAEESLRESEKQLRYLSSQLLTAQETERRRISEELHDELGQALMAIKLQVSSIGKKLKKDQGAIRRECEDTLEYIDQTIESVRRLSKELSPFILKDLGLPVALRWLANEFGKHYHVEVSIDIKETDHLLPQESQLAVYRIFQETLTNIGKHAQATRIFIAAKQENGSLSFMLEDNGKGFDMGPFLTKSSVKGLGLLTMEERVRMLGGSLNIWSLEGKGTQITFQIPVKKGET